jgi:hypothetical protein
MKQDFTLIDETNEKTEIVKLYQNSYGITLSNDRFNGLYDNTFLAIEIYEGELRLLVFEENKENPQIIKIKRSK